MAGEIQWGSVADWASAFGSVAASIVALWLARSADRVKLKGLWGLRAVVGDGQDGPELLHLRATNIGRRTAKITHTALRWGFPRRRHGLILMWDPVFSSSLPVVLEDGHEASWSVPLGKDDPNRWFREELFKEGLPTWLDVWATRAIVHTSHGERLVLRPEEGLLKRLHAARFEMRERC